VQQQVLFPRDEFTLRATRVRTEMESRGLDGLVVTGPENVYYLTGYQTIGEVGSFLLLPLTGEPTLVLRWLESPLAAYTTYVENVVTFDDVDDPMTILAAAVHDSGLRGRRIGVDESTVTATLRARIDAALAPCTLVSSAGVVETARVVKTPSEVEACRRAAVFTGLGMRAAFAAAGAGVTENQIAAAAFSAMAEAGSEWLTTSPIVTSGDRGGIPHTSYNSRPVAAGDAILLEFSGCHFRYNSPLMRTVVVGEAPKRTAAMYRACLDALEAAMAAIRPGVTSGEAHAACQRVIDDAGFTKEFRKRLGYACGIGFKTWSEGSIFDLKAGDPRPIQAGMVIHMPPALRVIPEVGVGVSETILVTDSGCEPLATLDRSLVIA